MSFKDKRILVTGAAGFIGSALIENLLFQNAEVIGVDNINNYYSQNLKRSRLLKIKSVQEKTKTVWDFHEISIEDENLLFNLASKYKFDIIVHLAAQAGVRYSLENPDSYIDSNLKGFGNILELCRHQKIKNFIFASSSSVYGNNKNIPFSESHNVDHPISLYAATKKANEVMAHSYSHLYGIPTTGLRFFTVYGPFGRPDMAPMIFANAILKSQPINIYNFGKMKRDFTFIDDIVEGILGCCEKPAFPEEKIENIDCDPSISSAPYRIFNIGNNKPVELNYFIELLEEYLQVKAIKNFVKIQPGDVKITYADTSKLDNWIGYKPKTSIEKGIKEFTKWYKNYYYKKPL